MHNCPTNLVVPSIPCFLSSFVKVPLNADDGQCVFTMVMLETTEAGLPA